MNPSDAKLLSNLNNLELKRKRIIVYQKILLDRITRTKNEIYQRNNMISPKNNVEKENRKPLLVLGQKPNSRDVTKTRAAAKGKKTIPANLPLNRFQQAQLIAQRIKDNDWMMPPIRTDQCQICRATLRDPHVCNIENCFFGCACGFLAKSMNAINGHSIACRKRNKDLAKYEAQLNNPGCLGHLVKSEEKNVS
ncbi:hypothetical protein M5D96_006468 [Drosophila gunungcola]|uniref:Uncharacterized protein n=1 Tax=Drosophila gunungcola TaxID=103775 RepID=A0A9P9YP09_9MUSC|nr:hypothetical protein M5D96_006468 [Drosophila gunungcola]